MKDESKRWIQAAIILGNNPKAKVLCPKCQKDRIKIIDVRIDDNDKDILERHMYCSSCGARNALLKSSPERKE